MKGTQLNESIKKEQIKKLKIPGVSFMPEKARVYPNEDFASYILGFARPDDKGNTEGKFGLEKSLDKYLRYLEAQKNKEYLNNEYLKNKIKELQNDNFKLHKKISICEYDLKSYIKMKQKVAYAKFNKEDFSIFFNAFNEYIKELEKNETKNRILLANSTGIKEKGTSSKKLLYKPKNTITENIFNIR